MYSFAKSETLFPDVFKTVMSTKDNPFLAMIPNAETLQANTQAMLDAMPVPPARNLSNLAHHPMAAAAAGSAVSMGAATQAVSMMFGFMSGMMETVAKTQKATKEASVFAPLAIEGMNPLKFEWFGADLKNAPAFNPFTFEWTTGETGAAPVTTAKVPTNKAATAPASKPESKAASQPVSEAATKVVAKVASPKSVAAKPAAKTKASTAGIAETPPAVSVKPVAKPSPTETAVIAPEDFAKPKAITKPEIIDDLKLISGVGPKLETVLNGLGVWKFSQIAEWTPNEVAWVDDYLQFKGRIDRDEWISQARVLAAK